jgi:hypothetical protein
MIINLPVLTNQLDTALGGVDLTPEETASIVGIVLEHMNEQLAHPMTVTLANETE